MLSIYNKNIDFLFIKFPILFPLLYLFFYIFFPNYENFLIIFTIFLLAEPHFGATWPFICNSKNKDIVFKNKLIYILLPVSIVIFSVLGYFFFKIHFLLIFYFANFFHVTRQSVGISKLYIEKVEERELQASFIYFYGFILFFIGFFRFYFPIIEERHIINLNIIMISLMIFLLSIYFYFYRLKNIFTLLTGLLIFYPICFVEKPVHAILMGVTMHYSQYLTLTYKINKERTSNQKSFFLKKLNIFFIIIYSITMSIISYYSKGYDKIIENLLIIPICGQMLHFYLDSLFWRFSNQEIRNNTLPYLFKKC